MSFEIRNALGEPTQYYIDGKLVAFENFYKLSQSYGVQILDNSGKQIKGDGSMSTPTQYSYEEALRTKELYEKRQKELKWIAKQLGEKLQLFTEVKFRVNKSRKEITFAGLHKESGKIKLTTSTCSHNDKFDINIGKLIAVKKALKEDLDNIEILIEKDNTGGFITADSIIGWNKFLKTNRIIKK